MDRSTYTWRYDLFKLIVALLLLILVLLLWRNASLPLIAAPTPVPGTMSVPGGPSATTDANPTSTSTAAPLPSPTPTVESRRTASLPTPTATFPATPTSTVLPSPTRAVAIEPTPTTPPAFTACEAAGLRSRLEVGNNATILRRLNFRSSPGIRNNWLRTNIPGTGVAVIGGPECLPHLAGAYLWWQIKLPDGETGWSAEGSIHGTFYFMEPAE